jgi:serine/threonine-protein kinase
MLAGYRLEALVGSGGMAVVFRARDERLDRLVALKILEPSRAAAADPAFRERFIAESRAAAKVDHPNIIPVYEADEADGVPFIAMRFVHGADLRQVLERQGALVAERAVEYISQVASALDAAHAAGLIHRDVKPENILVDTRTEHVYLTDFGIAKAAVPTTPLTQPGFLVGTVDYLAPEQIDGQHAGARADQYALGCVAYQLLTGAPPFRRDEILAVMAAHLYAPPPPLTGRRPDLPGAADKVLATVMAKAPDQRYESCTDFAAALREALGVAPYRSGRPVPLSAPPPRVATEPAAALPARPAEPVPAYVRPAAGNAPAPSPGAGSAELLTPRRAAPPPPPLPPPLRTPAGRRPRALPGVRVWLPLTILAAAVALILVAVLPRLGKQSTVNSAGLGTSSCGSAFPGHQGQQGGVTVRSVASAGGTRLAVGGAGGHPAIWRCSSGSWQLVPAGAVPALQGSGELSSVAHGPDGWIAVGDAGSGAAPQPVAVTSANGESWQPVNSPTAFTGPGACVTAVAAGQHGYAVVGKHVSGSRVFAAMWPSADLRSWAQGDNDAGGTLDGRLQHSMVDAVAVTPGGFVAVGTHGSGGVIWTSADGGQQWTFIDYSSAHVPNTGVPAGALLVVAAGGSRIVTAGYQVAAGGGDVPVVVVSTDGGLHWNPPIALGTPGGQGGRVTALTVAGSGFTAAGQVGRAGAQHTVTWRSPDGLTWSKAAPAASGTSAVTALAAAGETVTGAAQQCGAG